MILATILAQLSIIITVGLCTWFRPEKHASNMVIILSVGVLAIVALLLYDLIS